MHNTGLAEIQLPDEVQAYLDESFPDTGSGITQSPERLAALSTIIANQRDLAVTYRASSGIEEIWSNAEDAYVGIDNVNRGEYANAKWIKPTSKEGPVTTSSQPRGQETKSTAFVRLTARYVDAGHAKLCEILLPADDKAFSFGPTPVPDLTKGKDDTSQVIHQGLPLERPMKPDEVAQGATGTLSAGGPPMPPLAGAMPPTMIPPPVAGAEPPLAPLTIKDLVEEAMEIATQKAKKAEDRIYDWMVECQYQRQMRKVIFDAARLGVGVLKAPYPEISRSMSLSKEPPAESGQPNGNGAQPKRMRLEVIEEVKPAAKWVSAWDFFPDPSCGETIHDGDHVFERDYLSRKKVRDLKKNKGYIKESIDKVLKEGPKAKRTDNRHPTDSGKELEHRFEIWYFYGTISREDLAMLNPDDAKELRDDQDDAYAIVTMINDTVVFATLNPLDSGEFPYHTVPWQRRVGQWAGVGIPEQVQMPQRMVNAATRAMLNNAGKSAGSQIIIDLSSVKPADGEWVLFGDKIWVKGNESDDVRKAFNAFQIPNITPQLMTIIEYAFRLAEESTNIPLITQGQSGKTTPDTYGAAQLQNNNANQLLRNIGYTFDDHITEPVVRQFYEWLLLDPDIPDDEKGDFKINAHGSIALVERAIQDQSIIQMGQIVENPVFGIDPKRWFKQMMKAKRLNPVDFQYTEQEQEKIDKTPPPPDPRVQVATIKAQADAQQAQLDRELEKTLAEIEMQTILQRAKLDTDRDTTYVTAETERTRAESQARLQELIVKKELAILDYSNKRGISVEQAKAAIAQTAMKLRVQKELAMLSRTRTAPEVTKAPTEPPGRAPAGEAYQK